MGDEDGAGEVVRRRAGGRWRGAVLLLVGFVLGGVVFAAGGAVAARRFPDVDRGAFYADAVDWAAENGITTGYGNTGEFRPDLPTTRGQMVVFLQRLYDHLGMGAYQVVERHEPLLLAPDVVGEVIAACPPGKWAVGGGASVDAAPAVSFLRSAPLEENNVPGTGWVAAWVHHDGGLVSVDATVYAICLPRG